MGEIIDINAELEYKKAVEREKFWVKIDLIDLKDIFEKIDREIMADIEKKDGEQ